MGQTGIGVIGAGRIGLIHCDIITNLVSNARIVAINDVDEEHAAQALELTGARFEADPQALIESPDVDAVLVTSWDPTHEQYVIACIKAGKYVFCEKPLSNTSDGCRRIMEAEIAGGKRLAQVGFMRRFDEHYRALKRVLDSGQMGKVLMLHCSHRVPWPGGAKHTTDTLITRAVSHEFDINRWLLGEDYATAQVVRGRPSSYAEEGLEDPQLVILRTQSGVVIDIEISMHAKYGYQVSCEAVCDEGTVRLASPAAPEIRRDLTMSQAVCPDWHERFRRAYEVELFEWVESVRNGKITGPSAWDGYQSSAVADVAVAAGEAHRELEVAIGTCPDFYRES